MKRILFWLILIIVATSIGAFLLIEIDRFTKSISYPSQFALPKRTESIEKKTITLVLVGDIMLDRGVEYMVEKQGDGDFRFPFLKIADYLKNSDIVFGNLEGPISDKGTKVGSIYSFQNDPKVIEGLSYAGFDVMSLANNHAFDYGREALEDCLTRLSNSGISYVGAGFNKDEAYFPIIKEVNGVKIAFLAFTNLGSPYWAATEISSGIAWADWNNLEEIKKDIENAKLKSDILIVSLHSGKEYQKTPAQFQTEFSKMAIDAGADLVFGHHPHIVQKNEKYQAGYIFYSLGNFVFDQSFSEETTEGQILKVLIENKKIKEIIPINIKINNSFQPEIYEKTNELPLAKVYLSSDKLEQGDTLLIKIPNGSKNKIVGELDSMKIDFFKPETKDNWIAILGIDVKKKPGKYNLVINTEGGAPIFKKDIEVIERKFPITELLVTKELEEKGFTPSKIVEDLISKENPMIAEIFSIYTPKAYFSEVFINPLKEMKVEGAFGNIRKSENVSIQHLGVDLAADIGKEVYAIGDGFVRFSQELPTYGKTLMIDHGLGIFSLYLHLKEFKVLNGMKVKGGDVIGLSGNTGYAITPHLHFSVKINGLNIDPLRFIEVIEEELR